MIPTGYRNKYKMEIRRRLNTHDIVECGKMARHRIAELLHQIPLGGYLRKGHEKPEVPKLSAKLMEVFPLLARSATFEEVCRRQGFQSQRSLAARRQSLPDTESRRSSRPRRRRRQWVCYRRQAMLGGFPSARSCSASGLNCILPRTPFDVAAVGQYPFWRLFRQRVRSVIQDF
jgi:hypothetical protein